METVLLVIAIVLLLALLALTLLVLRSSGHDNTAAFQPRFDALSANLERIERAVREESAAGRKEAADAARLARSESSDSLKNFQETLLARMAEITHHQKSQLDSFAQQLSLLTQSIEKRLEEMRSTIERKLTQLGAEATQNAAQARSEQAANLKNFTDTFAARMGEIAQQQRNQLELFSANLATLTQTSEQKLEAMRGTIEAKLTSLQQDNTAKLEQMRQTVDEKLHATLEKRLGESFKIVSQQLDLVSQGLGQMQAIASDVGGLKKVLSNIKTRGNWGEVQLGNLLSQMLTPEQFAVNVQVNPESPERVEYAIALPGRSSDARQVWLPIDAKFPQEDYQRLVEASERGDSEAVAASTAALEQRVCGEARKIRQKYVCPPHTTDFAILFLPTEGLFAEVLRRPGLCDRLLHEQRVVLTGPTTLSAVLSSLQMGFRTLAIEKRSSEVWQVLGAVKTEFGKFGEVLEKVDKKLHEASNVISDAQVRRRAVDRQLKGVAATPEEAPQKAIAAPPPAAEPQATLP